MKPLLAPFSLVLSTTLLAQAPAVLAPPVLPVREVTVFKDGHAYVVREMALPADANGKVVLDELPEPVLGTFWPFATDGASLVAAKAGRESVATDQPAVDLRQIASANVGKTVVVVMHDKERVDGKLLALPVREPTKPSWPGAVPNRSAAPAPTLLLVQTASGTRALSLDNVREIEVHGEFAANVREQVDRERLTLTVAGGGAKAKVGVMYVQKGMRWIPSYRLDIDGAGKAAVQLEATLVNDLVDLERATVHLVVGVPTFEFEGMLDPISLQDEMAQVAASPRQLHESRNALANSLRTQSAGFVGGDEQREPPIARDGAAEDLFVFTVADVTLKRGERLVLPISTFQITYRDVYELEVPFAPPVDVRQALQSERMVELARQLAAPRARHVLRLQNTADVPLTTAPALVLASGRVLAQARLTYTPKGREVDLEINPAIDIRVESEEHEVKREGPIHLGDDNYRRVDVAGSIVMWNGKAQPVVIEVSRRVLGLCDEAGQGGSNKQLDLVQAWYGADRPGWWGSWSWPHWWFAHNGFGEFRWQVELAPGATTKLDATWHYFWR